MVSQFSGFYVSKGGLFLSFMVSNSVFAFWLGSVLFWSLELFPASIFWVANNGFKDIASLRALWEFTAELVSKNPPLNSKVGSGPSRAPNEILKLGLRGMPGNPVPDVSKLCQLTKGLMSASLHLLGNPCLYLHCPSSNQKARKFSCLSKTKGDGTRKWILFRALQ